LSKADEERQFLIEELADKSIAYTPTTVERVKATKSFVGSQVGPTTGLAGSDNIPMFTPIRSVAQDKSYGISPTMASPRVVGTTFDYRPTDVVPEWDTEQRHEGIRIPGEIHSGNDFMRQAEKALTEYHTQTINKLIQRRAPVEAVHQTRARFERNMVRLKQGHMPTIANALGLMGHPVAVDAKKASLAIAQFHTVNSLRWLNSHTQKWEEQPTPSGENRPIGAYSDEIGGGFILPDARRPRRTQGQ